MKKMLANPTVSFVAYTLFYLTILLLLVFIYGFHDMNAGPFIYTEF